MSTSLSEVSLGQQEIQGCCHIPEFWDAMGRCPGLAESPDCHLPFLPDKYYRVNLRTKRVDLVHPRYPRSIAQYWLDCPQPGEEST